VREPAHTETDVRVDPVQRVRLAGRRFAEPVESVTQTVARRATELVVETLDVNALLDRTDLNRLLDQIDVNRLLNHVDMDRLLDRVDVDSLLDRVDVDRLISRVDMPALLRQVDVNEIADRVDVAALVERTELGDIVARSSTTIFSETIDLVRSQAVGLDNFLARWVARLLRREYAGPPAPGAPATLGRAAVPGGAVAPEPLSVQVRR
jgi:hypothetical protein